MIDLQSLSLNLLLVGFALVSICCLYLLYSNFTKVRDIEDLKHKVEDLKNIFFNQQKHNDDTYDKIMNILQKDLYLNSQISQTASSAPSASSSSNTTEQIDINNNKIHTKFINIDTTLNNNINLQELDDMADMDDIDNMDELNYDIDNLSNLDADDNNNNYDDNYNDNNIDDNVYIPDIEDNIFNSIHVVNNNTSKTVCDDTISIATDPMISELDLNEIMEGSNTQDLKHHILKDNDLGNGLDDLHNDLDDLDNDLDNNLDDLDNGLDDLDNDLDDLDNDLDDLDNDLELDLDTNNEINFNETKQINIDNNDTLLNTITINNSQQFINLDNSNSNVKTISVNENSNYNNTETEIETETIELDKLLSGEIKKIEINNKNTDLNTMSIKQLKELAKTHNIKISGNKKDLITALSNIKQ